MILYYFPPAASIAPLIVALELDIDITLEYVDLTTKRIRTGEPLQAVNPKDFIPVMKLDNGEILTETSVMMSYLADLKPEVGLNAKACSPDHYRIAEWMSFFASEIHKFYTILFWDIDERAKAEVARRILEKFDFIEAALKDKKYLVGGRYSIADIYLYAVIRGLHLIEDVDMTRIPNVAAFKTRIEQRPAVIKAEERHSKEK